MGEGGMVSSLSPRVHHLVGVTLGGGRWKQTQKYLRQFAL